MFDTVLNASLHKVLQKTCSENSEWFPEKYRLYDSPLLADIAV